MWGVYRKTSFGLFLLGLITCLFALHAARAADQKIIFYTVDFPPYEFQNPDSSGLRGFDIDVVIEAFKRMNIDADVDFLPWKRVISSSQTGAIAGAVSCVYTKEREAFYRFSAPISYSTQTFAYTSRYQGPALKTIQDASGLRILVVAGYAAETELKEANIPYETAMSDQAAINRLMQRPYDVFYTVREFMEYSAKKAGFSDKVRFFDITRTPYHLCLSRRWPDSARLLAAFSKGLAQIRADGTYQKIHNKYR